ncbi:MAG: uroporphyrinogen decarboxylase [Pseudomonadota bacterium]
MGSNSEKKLLRVLSGQSGSPPPIWLMRQAGRYLPEYRALRAKAGSFLDLCYTPDYAIEVTLQPICRFGFDASILFSDILVVPDALGQKLWFVEGEGPRLEPISQISDLGSYDRRAFLDHLRPVFETVTGLRSALPKEVTLIGFCGAPWTVASYMVAGRGTPDLAPLRALAETAPQRLRGIIDRLVEASIDYLIAQVEAGAEVLQIFESWAQVLDGPAFATWSLDPVGRIISGVRAIHPDVPIIVFPRKAGEGYGRVVETLPVNAVSIDPELDLAWARDHLQSHVAVQGNIDPQSLVKGPDAIDPAVDRLVSTLGDGPLIVNLGHGIDKTTPIEHVEHLIRRVRG